MRHPKATKDGRREVVFELSTREVAELVLSKLIEEFRKEGFFTTLLSSADHIWEIAMDDIELTIRRKSSKITFVCTPAEEAIVMTAWMEVASQLNDLARSISKPIRKEDVGKMLSASEAVKRGHEGVAKYIQGFVMIPKFKAANKADAIEQLVNEIARQCPNHLKDPKAAVEAVMRREESMPTGLAKGLALPHGRSSCVKGIAGAVAVLDDGGDPAGALPDYETIDSSPVKIIVLTIASDSAQTPYLKLMSFISRALRADNGAARLAQCKTANEMRRFFRHAK